MNKCCGTCVHSAYLNSDRDYMRCNYPQVPTAYTHGFIYSSDCSFPGIYKDSGENCPCYQQMDLTPSNGKWAVLKLSRIYDKQIKDSDFTIMARFDTEKEAIIYCDSLRHKETTTWNSNGIPFNVIYVKELYD